MPLSELRQEIEFGLENLVNVHQRVVAFVASPADAPLKTSALTYECLGYYNAVEHLMVRILKAVGQEIPTGAFSHRDTLKMFQSVLADNGIEDPATLSTLQTLMAFRHVATKIYGFLIDWPRLQAVVNDVQVSHPRIVDLFQRVTSRLAD